MPTRDIVNMLAISFHFLGDGVIGLINLDDYYHGMTYIAKRP